jgi:hypothetical protein
VKGQGQVGQGFSVSASKLIAGSTDVTGLQGRCESIAGDAVNALAGMAGSAAHAGLASALTGAVGQGFRAFVEMGVAYRHVSDSLTASAETYADTERNLVARTGAMLRGLG